MHMVKPVGENCPFIKCPAQGAVGEWRKNEMIMSSGQEHRLEELSRRSAEY